MSDMQARPLPCLASFFETLHQRGIRYCHWKSNAHLSQSLQGQTDLDLLVDRRQAQQFREILGCFGLKAMQSPVQKQYPAIEDYLGFDSATGKLFHLHIHYQLVVGEQFVKNYRLPLEDAFLASARPHGCTGVMVPGPEWELVILVSRLLLKIRDRDLIKAWLGRIVLPKRVLSELEYLVAQVNWEEFQVVLEAAACVIPGNIVLAFLEAWQAGQLTSRCLFRLRYRLRQALSSYQRWPRWRATGVYLTRVLQQRWRRGTEARKQLATGGLTIAFVGADGAGKSTLVATISHWLKWKLDVCGDFHLGSSQPSWVSRGLRLPFRLSSRLHQLCETQLGKENILTQFVAIIRYFLDSLLSVALGMDRYRRYRLGRRAANQGSVVLFDRFPLPEVYHAMDGPYIDPAWGNGCGWLARLERHLYQAITHPDHIIILHVSPEVSVSRKPDHRLETIITKSAALRKLQEQDEPYIDHVNADASLDQVLLQVKRIVWGVL
jgi:thymidylate kinase